MDDDLWTDEEDEELLAELKEERRAAAELVHETFPDLARAEPPQPDLAAAAAVLRKGVATGAWSRRKGEPSRTCSRTYPTLLAG